MFLPVASLALPGQSATGALGMALRTANRYRRKMTNLSSAGGDACSRPAGLGIRIHEISVAIDSAAILFLPDENARIFWPRHPYTVVARSECPHPAPDQVAMSIIVKGIDLGVVLYGYSCSPVEERMRKTALVMLATLATSAAFAQPKDCEELKAEIDAKISANGVGSFTTTIVDRDATEDGQVVGTCDNGARKIVYKRG
jgi:hypothetical protein